LVRGPFVYVDVPTNPPGFTHSSRFSWRGHFPQTLSPPSPHLSFCVWIEHRPPSPPTFRFFFFLLHSWTPVPLNPSPLQPFFGFSLFCFLPGPAPPVIVVLIIVPPPPPLLTTSFFPLVAFNLKRHCPSPLATKCGPLQRSLPRSFLFSLWSLLPCHEAPSGLSFFSPLVYLFPKPTTFFRYLSSGPTFFMGFSRFSGSRCSHGSYPMFTRLNRLTFSSASFLSSARFLERFACLLGFSFSFECWYLSSPCRHPYLHSAPLFLAFLFCFFPHFSPPPDGVSARHFVPPPLPPPSFLTSSAPGTPSPFPRTFPFFWDVGRFSPLPFGQRPSCLFISLTLVSMVNLFLLLPTFCVTTPPFRDHRVPPPPPTPF